MVRGLRGARVGAIGARPAAFQTVRYSEKLLQSTGITVVPVDLSEILSCGGKLRESSARTCRRSSRDPGIRDDTRPDPRGERV